MAEIKNIMVEWYKSRAVGRTAGVIAEDAKDHIEHEQDHRMVPPSDELVAGGFTTADTILWEIVNLNLKAPGLIRLYFKRWCARTLFYNRG